MGCESCRRNVCESCHATCCRDAVHPRCLVCARARPGFWTCVACDAHVCRACAPTNQRPQLFFNADTCAACTRKRRAPIELQCLAPVLARMPVSVHAAIKAAVSQ